MTFRPSTQPVLEALQEDRQNEVGEGSIDELLKDPITGIAVCCARAARGHAAAPPSSVMNWA